MNLAPNFSFDEQLLPRSLGDAPEPRQPPFGVGISSFSLALSAQLWVPVAFRQAAFASWFFLFPLRRSALLTGGLLKISTCPETSLGFPRSAWARCNWGGCLLYCGDGCPHPWRNDHGFLFPFIIVKAVSMTWPNAASSKVQSPSSFQFSPDPVASFGLKLP